MKWTPSEIEERFEEAAATLRRLPPPPGSGARGYGRSWPDYVRDARHAYGYHEALMRVVPSARQIARMEEAILWLRLIGPDEARMVWLRAEGAPWKAICYRLGVVRSTAWRRWVAALQTVANHLNANEKTRKATALAKT